MSEICCSLPSAGSAVCELPSPNIPKKLNRETVCPECNQKGKIVQGQTVKAPLSVTFWVWPIVRVLILQIILMMGFVGNIVGWLVLALLVDTLHWLDIDFYGKTLNTISPDGNYRLNHLV